MSEQPKKPTNAEKSAKKPDAKTKPKAVERPAAETIKFVCPRCKAGLKVGVEIAGRYIPCPKCEKKIPVPESQTAADDEARALDVAKFVVKPTETCPKCEKKLKKGSVFCVKCGFDFREGKKSSVIDKTTREDDVLRGKPAFAGVLIGSIFGGIALITLIVRIVMGGMIWWEQAIELDIFLKCAVLLPFWIKQYLDYRNTPRRESPTVLEEDRAEREEAVSPLGYYTAPVMFLCVIVAVMFCLIIWGGEDWLWFKTFVWSWTSYIFGGIFNAIYELFTT